MENKGELNVKMNDPTVEAEFLSAKLGIASPMLMSFPQIPEEVKAVF
jgi:hypothetical protein